jgi:hypothetical protein
MKRVSLLAALVFSFGVTGATAKSSTLSYPVAKRAIQVKADAFAGARTQITSMFHVKPLAYSGRAEWDRINPTGCHGCGYDPVTGHSVDEPTTESCSVSLVATKALSGAVRVRTEDFLCY